MDDNLKPIIYTIFIVIYIISRIFKGAKKAQKQASETVQPPVEKKPESLLDTIREEIKKQQELAKSQQELKPEEQIPTKKVVPVSPKKPIQAPSVKRSIQPEIEIKKKEEVVADVFKKIKTIPLTEELIEQKFEFDPREAFMMKTLLERHPSV